MQQYQLTRWLGRGGMGTIYEGCKLSPLNANDARSIAIKIVPPRDLEEEERQAAELFQREAVNSWRISHEHPNLVTTYDYGISANQYRYMVMELIDGVSLRAITRGFEPLEPHIIRRIARDVLAGLAHLHKRDFIHRDVSTGNIMLARSGEVKLTDFGLIKPAYRSVSKVLRGTVQYTAPEAYKHIPLGPLADLFALGVVLHRLVTGEYPYGESEPEIVDAILNLSPAKPLPDDTPDDLATVIRGLTQLVQRERRWHEALDVLAYLDQTRQPVASDDELAAVIADRSPQSLRSHHPNELPELGWPFAEMKAPESADDPAPTTPRIPRWALWAMIPFAFIAGLAVFCLALPPHEANSAPAVIVPAVTDSPDPVATQPTAQEVEPEKAAATARPSVSATASSARPAPAQTKRGAKPENRPKSRQLKRHGHVTTYYLQ